MITLPSLSQAVSLPLPAGSRPAWVPADAVWAIDAKADKYWIPFAITSLLANGIGREDVKTGYFQEVDDDWVEFGSTVLRRTDQGLISEPSRTNNVLYNRDLTQTEWVKTNCTAALDANGYLFNTVNTASTLTATGANATCLQAMTFTSRRIISSAYVKRVTGTGTIEITQDGGSTWATIVLTSSWQRFDVATVDMADAEFGFRITTSGDVIEVDLATVESNSGGNAYPSTPIITDDSNGSRAQDQLYVKDVSVMPATGSLLVKVKAITGVVRFGQQTSRNSRFIEFSDSVSGVRFSLSVISSGIQISQSGGGGSITYTDPGDMSEVWIAAAWDDGGDIRISINGAAIQTDTGYTDQAYDVISMGTSYQLSGDNDLWGVYEEVFIYDDVPSDAALVTRSTIV